MPGQRSKMENQMRVANSQKDDLNLSPYPVDMSSFLSLPNCTFNTGVPYQMNPARYDPTTIAKYALAHWNEYLATSDGPSRDVFLLQAQWLVEHEVRIGDDAGGWPISLPHAAMHTPEILLGEQVICLSALAQGCALSVLVRAYWFTQEKIFLEVARRAVCTFERDILDGGVSTPVGEKGIFFEEVAVYPAAHILSGFIFALFGLYDYVALTDDEQIKALIECSLATMHHLLDEFDVGFWTRSHLLYRQLASPSELGSQAILLEALATSSGCMHCSTLASRWKAYQRKSITHFRYLIRSRCSSFRHSLWARIQHTVFSSSQASTTLRVCIPVTEFPLTGGILTVLKDVARVTEDIWQIEYLTQDVEPNPSRLTIHRFGTKRMSPWLFPLVWFYVIAGFWKLISLLRVAGYHVILPQDGVFTSAFSALAAKLAGIRVVCIDHSTLTWPTSRILHKERKAEVAKKHWPWAFRQLVRILLFFYWPSLSLLTQLSARLVDHFLIPGVPGDEMEQVCSRLGIHPSRITRFASMIDIERHIALDGLLKAEMRAQKGIVVDAIVIAIICRLAPEKGLDIALESLHLALSEISPDLCSHVRIIIAGDGPLRKQIEEDISRYELNSCCALWGEISAQEVVALLAISDIFLYTSVRGACFPMAVLEAMASGCAVIASTEPIANKLLLAEGRGIAVAAGNVQETSAALVQLLNDVELCRRMGTLAREYIAMYHSPATFRRALLRTTYWYGVNEMLDDGIRTEVVVEECNEMMPSNRWKTKDVVKRAEPDLPSSPSLKETEYMSFDALSETRIQSAVECRLIEHVPPMYHGGIPGLLRLPTKGIDQWPTRVSLEAISYVPPVAYSVVDSVPIDQQITWIVPAREGMSSTHTQILKEGYVSQICNLVRSSGIYALSSLAAPLITLVLAPFLTHMLSHDDYGALAILTTVIALTSGVTQLGLGSAFFRAYSYDYESRRDRLDVLATTSLLLLFISVPTIITVVLAAPWLAQFLLNKPSLADAVRLAGLVVLAQNLTVPGLSWLRAENRATLFSILSIINLLVTAGATIVLVGVVHMGIAGSLVAIGAGYIAITIGTLPLILLKAGVRLRYDIAWGLITFGFPHVMNLLSGWVLQLSDRYLLGRFGSLSQAASYAVAYSVGGVASAFIITPFSLAWWSLMYSIAKRDDATRVFRLIFRWFSIVLLFATFGLSIFGRAVLDMFFPPTYYTASLIIPIIAASNVFNGIFIVISLGTSLQRKTWYVAALITCSALLNVVLNMFLIPSYGAMGAAVATLIAYFVLALFAYVVNQQIYPVQFEIGRWSIALLIGITLYLGSDFWAKHYPIYMAWSIRIGALILYGGCLLLYGTYSLIQRHFRRSSTTNA